VKDELEQVSAAMAAHVAHDRGWTLDQATRWVSVRMAEARAEYWAKGAPLGNTAAGFLAWLLPRHRPPTA
jgi:hypothetical protein